MPVTAQQTVQLDTQEPRVVLASQAVTADGRFWDANLSTAFVDPISRTGMLMPLCKTTAWTTGGCGRLGKSDLSIAGSSNYVEYQWQWASEKWIKALGVNEVITTNTSWPQNQPMYVGWYAFGTGANDFVQMECGWTGDPDIRLRFWNSGKCDVYKNGNFVGQGNIYERKVSSQNAYAKETISSKADSKQLAGAPIEVLLIPGRFRELIVLSNVGGGFTFIFEDIDPTSTDPIITGAGTFFVYVPTGQPTFQLAPLQFQTSGVVISLPNSFRDAPRSGETYSGQAYWDAPGYGSTSITATLLQVDGVSAFIANSALKQCRLKMSLTGDGTATPFVYGAAAVYPSIQAYTNSAHTSTLDDYIQHSTLSVPELPTDVLFSMTLNEPHALETTGGASKVRVIANRPIEAKIGSIAFLTGRTKPPAWTEAPNDTARELVLEARDRCMANEMHRIKSPVPLDGSNLQPAFSYFAQMPGYNVADMDIATIAYNLPTSGQTSEGEYALLPEVGDTSLQWIQKLWETYARNYFWGWVPRATGPKFRVQTLDTLNAATVSATLYGTMQEAMDALVPANRLMQSVYRSYRETRPFVEANDIWVTGRNPKTGKPLQTHYADTASQDPTTAPSLRPDNWLGEIWYYGWVDSSITSLQDGAWCTEQLARRLTPVRVYGEFQSDFLLRADGAPVWRGDTVRLVGLGTYRIISLHGDFKSEFAHVLDTDGPDRIWRPFTYCAERITTEAPYGTYAA